jgi:hypothetical protein
MSKDFTFKYLLFNFEDARPPKKTKHGQKTLIKDLHYRICYYDVLSAFILPGGYQAPAFWRESIDARFYL